MNTVMMGRMMMMMVRVVSVTCFGAREAAAGNVEFCVNEKLDESRKASLLRSSELFNLCYFARQIRAEK